MDETPREKSHLEDPLATEQLSDSSQSASGSRRTSVQRHDSSGALRPQFSPATLALHAALTSPDQTTQTMASATAAAVASTRSDGSDSSHSRRESQQPLIELAGGPRKGNADRSTTPSRPSGTTPPSNPGAALAAGAATGSCRSGGSSKAGSHRRVSSIQGLRQSGRRNVRLICNPSPDQFTGYMRDHTASVYSSATSNFGSPTSLDHKSSTHSIDSRIYIEQPTVKLFDHDDELNEKFQPVLRGDKVNTMSTVKQVACCGPSAPRLLTAVFRAPLTSNDPIRRLVDVLLVFSLLWTVITVPLEVAFFSIEHGYVYEVSDALVDCVFLFDVVLNFLTCVETDTGLVISDVSQIAKRYASGWFVFDLVATVPFVVFLDSAFCRVCRLMLLLKMLRVVQLTKRRGLRKRFLYMEYGWAADRPALMRLLRLLGVVVSAGHLTACLWYAIGSWDFDGEDEDAWIRRVNVGGMYIDETVFEDRPQWYRYLISLYWVFTTLSTVGYGDITPRTPSEVVFTIFAMIAGVSFFAGLMSTVASVVRESETQSSYMRKKVKQLHRFMRDVKLPADVREELSLCMRQVWTGRRAHPSADKVDRSAMLLDIPEDHRRRVALFMRKRAVASSYFFRTLVAEDESVTAANLIVAMTPLELSPGEYIFKDGETAWILIESGLVDCVHAADATTQFMQFGAGDTLGESALLLHAADSESQVQYRVALPTVAYMVPGSVFLKLVAESPSLRQKIKALAKWRRATINERLKARRDVLRQHGVRLRPREVDEEEEDEEDDDESVVPSMQSHGLREIASAMRHLLKKSKGAASEPVTPAASAAAAAATPAASLRAAVLEATQAVSGAPAAAVADAGELSTGQLLQQSHVLMKALREVVEKLQTRTEILPSKDSAPASASGL